MSSWPSPRLSANCLFLQSRVQIFACSFVSSHCEDNREGCKGRLVASRSRQPCKGELLTSDPAEKEAYLHDYNVRKGNVEAAEKALWNEELALHSLDVVSTCCRATACVCCCA